MRVRALDDDGDWTFGKGRNNYKRDNLAVVQNIQTRLSSFLGDCFFDNSAGLDWLSLLGAKDQLALNLVVSTIILNTIDVTGIQQISIVVSPVTRAATITYRARTSYSTAASTFVFDPNAVNTL